MDIPRDMAETATEEPSMRGVPADPSARARTGIGGAEAEGLAFGPGWDRQDRWLRFVDPVLERAYREAMTAPARRRFRFAASVAIAIVAIQPVQVPVVRGVFLGPVSWAVSVMELGLLMATIVWAGRVGLRGIWGLTSAAVAVCAIGVVAISVEVDTFFQVAALVLAALGVVASAWIRVAWWVAAAVSIALVILFTAVSVALAGGSVALNQLFFLAATLGCALAGSWFLESSERRSFAQGLLVDHLYQRVDHLFRQYLSPDVAATLVDDPGRAELGGEVVEVSVLFADLRGYTPFSERTAPGDVVSMLNDAFGAAVPAVFAEGGTIVQFMGDALMAIFNAPLRQSDHALRACRAGLALQAAMSSDPGAGQPRFRVGINTGPALVGNIGSAELRNFSALGDTTNVAARLQTYAVEGSVVIGERTYELVRAAGDVRALGAVDLKGKSTPTPVFELIGLQEAGREAVEVRRGSPHQIP